MLLFASRVQFSALMSPGRGVHLCTIELVFWWPSTFLKLLGSMRVRAHARVINSGDLPLRRPKDRQKCHNQRARMCTTQWQQNPPHAHRRLPRRPESSPDAQNSQFNWGDCEGITLASASPSPPLRSGSRASGCEGGCPRPTPYPSQRPRSTKPSAGLPDLAAARRKSLPHPKPQAALAGGSRPATRAPRRKKCSI